MMTLRTHAPLPTTYDGEHPFPGDPGLSVRRALFDRTGGYPDVPIDQLHPLYRRLR